MTSWLAFRLAIFEMPSKRQTSSSKRSLALHRKWRHLQLVADDTLVLLLRDRARSHPCTGEVLGVQRAALHCDLEVMAKSLDHEQLELPCFGFVFGTWQRQVVHDVR